MRYILFLPSKSLTLLFASNHLEKILSRVSQAFISAIRTSRPHFIFLSLALSDLSMLDEHPVCLITMTYEWCSLICENYQSLVDGNFLIRYSLQIGFRHLDPQDDKITAELIHTEHHQKLVGIVFGEGRYWHDEGIADLLQAWTSRSDPHEPYTLLKTCARHLVGLRSPSIRLRSLVIRAIEPIGYQEFEQVGVGKFLRFLDELRVGVGDMKSSSRFTRPNRYRVSRWARILLATIHSPEGIHLSQPYWEFLTELTIFGRWLPESRPQIMTSLEDAREWEKLECWVDIVWMLWPSEPSGTEELERVTLSLFRQRPSAIPRLEQWLGRRRHFHVPETFVRICEHARFEGAQQNEL